MEMSACVLLLERNESFIGISRDEPARAPVCALGRKKRNPRRGDLGMTLVDVPDQDVDRRTSAIDAMDFDLSAAGCGSARTMLTAPGQGAVDAGRAINAETVPPQRQESVHGTLLLASLPHAEAPR